MTDKRFTLCEVDLYKYGVPLNEIMDNGVPISQEKAIDLLNALNDENEQLKSELQGMEELLKSYRKTIKHDAGLLADATKNGYLPPLDTFYDLSENGEIMNMIDTEHMLNTLHEENKQLKKENEQLHQKIFEQRTRDALDRTEISKEAYTGKKTSKEYLSATEFLNEIEKW